MALSWSTDNRNPSSLVWYARSGYGHSKTGSCTWSIDTVPRFLKFITSRYTLPRFRDQLQANPRKHLSQHALWCMSQSFLSQDISIAIPSQNCSSYPIIMLSKIQLIHSVVEIGFRIVQFFSTSSESSPGNLDLTNSRRFSTFMTGYSIGNQLHFAFLREREGDQRCQPESCTQHSLAQRSCRPYGPSLVLIRTSPRLLARSLSTWLSYLGRLTTLQNQTDRLSEEGTIHRGSVGRDGTDIPWHQTGSYKRRDSVILIENTIKTEMQAFCASSSPSLSTLATNRSRNESQIGRVFGTVSSSLQCNGDARSLPDPPPEP